MNLNLTPEQEQIVKEKSRVGRPGVWPQYACKSFEETAASSFWEALWHFFSCHTRLRFSRCAILIIAATLRSTSRSVVAQQDTLMRIAVCPCHCVPPH